MLQRTNHHDAWACLLAYPDEAGHETALSGLDELQVNLVPGVEDLKAMCEFLGDGDVGRREELFTRTFDGSDDRALEIGWHLHGENYARGALMVRFRKLMTELELFETGELPDHLGVVLGLIGRLDEDRAGALARGVVVPAIEILLRGFGDEENPYRSAIIGMRRYLKFRHGDGEKCLESTSAEWSEQR